MRIFSPTVTTALEGDSMTATVLAAATKTASAMNAAEFFSLIEKRAPETYAAEDPLMQAQRFIDDNGMTGEGRALRHVVEALWTGKGEFEETDMASFGAKSLALIVDLVAARTDGRYPEWKWHRASCYPPWRFLLDLHKKYGL